MTPKLKELLLDFTLFMIIVVTLMVKLGQILITGKL